MDIVVADDNKKVIGTVGNESFVSVSHAEDVINGKIRFNVKVMYTETNWRLLRDAHLLFDNETPETPIKVDEVKVEDDRIVVLGHAVFEQLLN